jgi:UDP-N-acetylglucosamine--N-acetylmuramyl-(pentapeptide) pyrophosphoryl-undecaprenol N-acetylglucosamine transferase
MGTPEGLEARVIPEAGIDMVYLSVNGLRGKSKITLLLAPFQLARALFQSLGIMFSTRPAAVLGMGGFVAGPGGLVAALMGKPVVIHEQNAIPGLTNKLLSRFSKKILEGFPGTFKGRKNATGIGNPVRQDIASLPHPVHRLGDRWGRINLLIFGGSLGAQALNEIVPLALGELPVDKQPEVRHQAGKNKDAATRALYEKMSVKAEITPFIEDMAEAYEWADLVICRSGALTVAELAAAGLASVLVPYPFAVDDHQTANAKYLSEHGAALLMPQEELTKESLAEILADLGNNRDRLIEMSIAARNLAKPQATDEVAAICAELAGYDYDKQNWDDSEASNIKQVETITDPGVVDAEEDQEVKYEAA